MTIMNIRGSMPAFSTSSYAADSLSLQKKENDPVQMVNALPTQDKQDANKEAGFTRSKEQEECETCKNRKYQDGSNEHNVSFQTAAHIAPQSAASAVRAHENQHVANAYKKAALDNGKVMRASVSIKTSICPECGRSYVSGGTTNTQIKYYNEENPYQKDLKATDAIKYKGMNVSLTA